MKEIKPSILISIFKRKGGEGRHTKIIYQKEQWEKQGLPNLEGEEFGIILYYQSETVWFLLSNKKIRSNHEGIKIELNLENLKEVNLAMLEEFKAGIRKKTEYTRLKVTDKADKNYLLHLEKGLPYQGLFQVLHFLAGA